MIDSTSRILSFPRVLLVLALAFAVVPSSVVRADDAGQARARYNQGRKALSAGHFREAAMHFEAVARLKKHAAGPYAAAAAWEKADEPVRAADNYAMALTLPGLKSKAIKDAKKRLTALEETMGTLSIVGREDILVQFEGSTEVHPPARLHAMPGINTLLIARGDDVERRDIRLKVGEVKELNVTEPLEKKDDEPPAPIASASTVAPSPPPPPKKHKLAASTDSTSTRKLIGYSAMGAGVVSAGVAVVLGFQTLSARSDFEDSPTQDAYDHAVGLRTWTNVAWAGSVVLGGVGAALVFWPSKAQGKDDEQQDGGTVAVVPSPTGLQLQGTF